MRIPPLYREKSWQRFFAGFFIGLLFGWLFFLYHFGTVHEKLVIEISDQQTEIEKHEKTIEILREDQDDQNEENQKMLTVQDIRIHFINEDDVKLSELTFHELRSAVESELEEVRNKDIETVAKSSDFIFKTVENKIFIINDKRYQLEVKQLSLFTTLEMHVIITSAE
ncbi:sporulation membrane protein YtrI [Salipaludibacillus daqingensis]|uniref:sporulation membrane protein YtrI n=1 Tax=Salipaludibacillus daqingensis TaxID=3041001 RepID=UPI002474BC30|nr:sporulation membrane protein YtrI [Salipaludibacillus daqingensis]